MKYNLAGITSIIVKHFFHNCDSSNCGITFAENGDNKQLYAGTILRTYQTDYAIARPQMNNTLVNIRTYSSNAFWLNGLHNFFVFFPID